MNAVTRRPRICVLGMMTKIPVGGVVWQTLHYLEGFRRLGCDVTYVEAHARTPSMFMVHEDDDSSAAAAAFIERELRRIGLGDQWALWALHDTGEVFGTTEHGLTQMLANADAVINLHGGTDPALVEQAAGRLVYVETDPVQLQVELHDGVPETIAFLDAHEAFFTFGELWGRSTTKLPSSDRYTFHPTRQPVVCDWWDGPHASTDAPFTTIANWHQPWREVWFAGERYGWSKHSEFAAVSDLPRRIAGTAEVELALSGIDEGGLRQLHDEGWRTVDGLAVSSDADRYRSHIWSSRGEFTVAKDQNIRLRSGWFSDRSATYLVAGRPVITQSTGFEEILPTGLGLQSFTDVDSAVDAIQRVIEHEADARADARLIGREYFGHDAVLAPMLELIGLRPEPTATSTAAQAGRLPWSGLALRPSERRPLRLGDDTEQRILDHPLPALLPTLEPATPTVSIIVITWNHLAVTRLCLESLLGDPAIGDAEIIVVDNGSEDGTVDYLDEMSRRTPLIRPVFVGHNSGFAAATNLGISLARSDRFVLLNNDTIVDTGAIGRLVRHLDDPSIGVIGAMAPHAGNEARLATGSDTFGDHQRHARERADQYAGQTEDVAVVTLFCAALRRDTVEAVGQLDEDFAVGMFEDDDYAERVRRADLRCAIALDVIVHHWGEASFGDLFADDSHSAVFTANRSRFEQKWERTWQPHARRDDPSYDDLAQRIIKLMQCRTPAGADVAVISQGDDRLCGVPGRRARHFPALADGQFAGHHPADSGEAIRLLDEAMSDGARYLMVPDPSRWWLDYYTGFARRLDSGFVRVADEPATGVLFAANSGDHP